MTNFCETSTEEDCPPAELVATFTAAELQSASQETSAIYRGLVLAAALQITRRKLDCSLTGLARAIDMDKHTLYIWLKAKPIIHSFHFERNMERLAMALRGSE